MSDRQHTPGPWTAYEFGADWFVGNPTDDSGPMLRVGSWNDDREANAHLIAAAPDLLEALGMLDSVLDFGEPGSDDKPWCMEDWTALNEAFLAARAAIANATQQPMGDER